MAILKQKHGAKSKLGAVENEVNMSTDALTKIKVKIRTVYQKEMGGSVLRQALNETMQVNDISRRQVARKTGISRRQIKRWEKSGFFRLDPCIMQELLLRQDTYLA